jgi:uncharacterized protein YbjT (DUF2867 family)
MKKAIVFGASGLVGKKLVRQLLEDKRYHLVITPLRKKEDFIHSKLIQPIIDFESSVLIDSNADEVYCCIGTTMKQAGSKQAFKKIDLDLVVQIAQQAIQNGIKKFALVSAMGANTHSIFFYNQIKGKTEYEISQLGFVLTIIVRPSILSGTRKEIRWGESIAEIIMRTVSFILPKKYRPIPAYLVAKAMIDAMNNPNLKEIQIITSDQMQP